MELITKSRARAISETISSVNNHMTPEHLSVLIENIAATGLNRIVLTVRPGMIPTLITYFPTFKFITLSIIDAYYPDHQVLIMQW